MIDLDAYFARVSYDGARAPTLGVLRDLHLAHATNVPFENVDVQLGRPIRLDLPSLVDKIVTRRRGGYCFEQNTLFAAVLRRLGFRVTTLAARVRWNAPATLPRTHMLLAVDLDGRRYIADVGFGGMGLTGPLELRPGAAQSLPVDTYRFRAEEGAYVLEAAVADGADGTWSDLYVFTLEEHLPVDYEMGSWFTSTHPSSRFVQSLIVTRPILGDGGGRAVLHNDRLTVRKGHVAEPVAESMDDPGIVAALRQHFGIELTGPARFRFRDAGGT